MSNATMIGLLQVYFDGQNLSADDVVRLTGLPPETAARVAEAITVLQQKNAGDFKG